MAVMLRKLPFLSKDDLEAIALPGCRDRLEADICRRCGYVFGKPVPIRALFDSLNIFRGTLWHYEIATEIRFR